MQHEGYVRASAVDWISLALVVVGALNWGLVGVGWYLDANWNAVDLILGGAPAIENLVYLLVGLAGVYELYFAYQLYTAASRRETTGAS